jgi:NAD(P)-dependent dehydrogenase (short-subunit alcohol dehydrogenase family)
MKEAGYGRIVNITSAAVFGFALMNVYGAAKGGSLGFTRCLAPEGLPYGIKVNALGPSANTGAGAVFGPQSDTQQSDTQPSGPDRKKPGSGTTSTGPPELVAAAAAFLAHESCPFAGKYIQAPSGRVTEVFLGQTQGYENWEMTPEDVAANLDKILDRTDFTPIPDSYVSMEEVAPLFGTYKPA